MQIMKKTGNDWIVTSLILCYVVGLGLFTIAYVVISLRWVIVHDAPLFLYAGFLMDNFNYIPYRDFFEMNPPGTLLINLGLFKIIQFSDLRFRIADIIFLAILGMSIWVYLRGLAGEIPAITGTLLFAISYLSMGQPGHVSMQREYIALLPIVISLIIAFRFQHNLIVWRSFLIGICFGIASSIKPPLIITCPIIWGGMLLQLKNRQLLINSNNKKYIGYSIIGIILGLLAVFGNIFLYLWINNAWNPFREMALNYWPLYAQLNGSGQIQNMFIFYLRGLEFDNLFRSLYEFRFYGLVPLGILISFQQLRRQPYNARLEIVVLYLLGVCFLSYIWIGNKYWNYHQLPLFFVLSCIAGFVFWNINVIKRTERYICIAMVVFITLTNLPFHDVVAAYYDFQDKKIIHTADVEIMDVKIIIDFLKKNMKKGESIVPLDVTSGAIHAMYMAKVRIGSPFIYDFHFYHHCDSLYIQNLRKRFVDELKLGHPRFIIKSKKPWRPFGEGACSSFPELENLLDTLYHQVYDSVDFQILEREQT